MSLNFKVGGEWNRKMKSEVNRKTEYPGKLVKLTFITSSMDLTGILPVSVGYYVPEVPHSMGKGK